MTMGARLLILLCRLAAGAVMIKTGLGKLESGWIANHGIERTIADEHAFAFYRGFLTHTVAHHETLFSHLVVFGELAIGVCLVLGFLTRWAAFAGALMMVFFALSMGVAFQPAPPILMGLVFVLLGAIDAGHVAGVDRWLRSRAPSWVV
jgi:thiosulfate dehydrogenase (quinone) large subunit